MSAQSHAAGSGRRPRVMVLFGGRSGEHSISCSTASGVMRAIDRTAYDVLPVGVTSTGRWVTVPDDPDRWQIQDGRLPQVPEGGERVMLPADAVSREIHAVAADGATRSLGEIDVVFPLLHGPYGEDGTLQGALDLIDLPYVGAGVLASALGMDKAFMKVTLAAAGLPVIPYTVITAHQWAVEPAECRRRAAKLGWPVFVKPVRAGSSLGISKVTNPEDLDQAILAAQKHDAKVLVEAAIIGREIECAVLGSCDGLAPRTAPPGEIVVTSGHDFYDFEAKYLDEQSVALNCPADLPTDIADRIRQLAAQAFEALGCEGLSRVDFFYTVDGEIVINEINTMPGFTPFSMYPQMWAAAGLDYPGLVNELIQLALNRPVGLR